MDLRYSLPRMLKISEFFESVKDSGDEIDTILKIINKNAKYVKVEKITEQERQRQEKKNEKIMDRDEEIGL